VALALAATKAATDNATTKSAILPRSAMVVSFRFRRAYAPDREPRTPSVAMYSAGIATRERCLEDPWISLTEGQR
jgi:hypothetical protein